MRRRLSPQSFIDQGAGISGSGQLGQRPSSKPGRIRVSAITNRRIEREGTSIDAGDTAREDVCKLLDTPDPVLGNQHLSVDKEAA